MHLMQLVRCAMGHHIRSGKRSRIVDGQRVSFCRGCGRKMVTDDFTWQLTDTGSATLVPRDQSET